jgi:HEAT repeat protein
MLGLLLAMASTTGVVDLSGPPVAPTHVRLQIEIPPISDRASLKRVMSLVDQGGPEVYQAFFDLLKRPDPPSQGTGIWALRQMGRLNAAAVPYLIPMLKDDWLAFDAADALSTIGPESKAAVPGLIPVLKSHYEQNRHQAAWALGRIGPDAKSALPALRQAMKDTSPYVKFSAALAIRRVENQPKKEIIAFLIESLAGSRAYWAIQALGEMGPEAKEAVPYLLAVNKSHRHGVYWHMGEVLRRIDPELRERRAR